MLVRIGKGPSMFSLRMVKFSLVKFRFSLAQVLYGVLLFGWVGELVLAFGVDFC